MRVLIIPMAALALLLAVACGGPAEPPVEFEAGLLALADGGDGVEVRPAMVGRERRPTLSLQDGEAYRSPWVRVPEGAVLELACGFYRPPFGDGPRRPGADEPSPRARFEARLRASGGRWARMGAGVVSSGSTVEWIDREFDLSRWAGAAVQLELRAELLDELSEDAGPVLPVWAVPRLRAGNGDDETRLVVLVSLDTLRADTLGAYGSSRLTSPCLDRLAREGVQYSVCLSPSPWTRPSHMSLLTSLYPHVHGLDRQNNLTLSRSFSTLAEVLAGAGFWTEALTGGGYLYPNHGFERGFEHYFASGEAFEGVAELAGARAVRRQGVDQFLFLHTYAVHEPYNRMGNYKLHSAGLPNPTQGSLPKPGTPILPRISKRLRMLYDDGMLYTDNHLGAFFRRLKAEGLWDRAMIVVVSDHGEMFMEHGHLGHSIRLYEELLRVPMVVKYPRGAERLGAPKPGTVVHQPVELLDVLPTVAAVYGIETPAADQFQGRSLLGGDGRGWQYAETWSEKKERRAIRADAVKYVVNRTDELEEVFDLSTDPGERRDLAAGGWGGEVYGGRVLLGLAESMGQDGLHLAVTWPGNNGGERRVRNRLIADGAIRSVTANFPREAGRVTLLDSGREVRFDLRPHRVPLDFTVELDDRSTALSVSFDRDRQRPVPQPDLFLGSGHAVDDLPAADDERYSLRWGQAPGSAGAAGDGPRIQFYTRPPRAAQQPGQTPVERREMLKALGYLE